MVRVLESACAAPFALLGHVSQSFACKQRRASAAKLSAEVKFERIAPISERNQPFRSNLSIAGVRATL
jgi:hypothetical protein